MFSLFALGEVQEPVHKFCPFRLSCPRPRVEMRQSVEIIFEYVFYYFIYSPGNDLTRL